MDTRDHLVRIEDRLNSLRDIISALQASLAFARGASWVAGTMSAIALALFAWGAEKLLSLETKMHYQEGSLARLHDFCGRSSVDAPGKVTSPSLSAGMQTDVPDGSFRAPAVDMPGALPPSPCRSRSREAGDSRKPRKDDPATGTEQPPSRKRCGTGRLPDLPACAAPQPEWTRSHEDTLSASHHPGSAE